MNCRPVSKADWSKSGGDRGVTWIILDDVVLASEILV